MTDEVRPLTSIRGGAVYHFHQRDAIAWAPLANLVRRGYFWVDLFFVLSGFVMAMTYGAMFNARYDGRAHRDFLLKRIARIARIYPLYLAVTLAVSLSTLAVYHGYQGVHRPGVNLAHPLLAHVTNLLMIQAWGFGSSIGGPTWTISTEWAAYLVFPPLLALALYRGAAAAWLTGLGAALVLWYVGTHVEAGRTVRNGQLDLFHCHDAAAVLRCVAGFSIGLLAFRVQGIAAARALLGRDAVCLGLFLALLAGMALKIDDLVLYPLLPLLVIALASVKGWAKTLFSAPPLYALGVLSYAIYLVHDHFGVLLEQLDLRLPHYLPAALAPWLAAAITYGGVLATAMLSYRFIEKPWRGRLRRAFATG